MDSTLVIMDRINEQHDKHERLIDIQQQARQIALQNKQTKRNCWNKT